MEYCSIEKAKAIVEKKYANAIKELNLIQRGFQMPKILWKAMGIRRAGYCDYTDNVIALNTNYLQSKDWEAFLDDTPLHELAHAISWQLFDETGHKDIWKNICYQIGLRGNRCHNFAKPENPKNTRTRKRYSAYCSCMEHIITSIKYNRMLKGTRYICVKCHGDLKIGE